MRQRELFAWRAMSGFDLDTLDRIAAEVHPDFPEDSEVLAERVSLYPAGCYLLEIEVRPVGYILSHPWMFADPPALNRKLKKIPAEADTYYIHDLALLPVVRRMGAPTQILEALAKHAKFRGFATMSLVAVNRTAPFWARHGFEIHSDAALHEKLKSYAGDAAYMVRHLG